MSIKYIGLFAIFIACTAVGFGLAGNEGKRLKNNEALISLIRYIRQRIGFFKSTTSEIYQTFENDLFKKNGFTEILREDGLHAAITTTDIFELDEQTENALIRFSADIGKLPIGELISSCDYLLELLNDNQKKLFEQYPSKRKAYSSLGMLFGIMAVILLF